MKTWLWSAVLLLCASGVYAQKVEVDSFSDSRAIGEGGNAGVHFAPIEITNVPKQRRSPWSLGYPGLAHDSLFIEPGTPINQAVADLFNRFENFCGARVTPEQVNSSRSQPIEQKVGSIQIIFEPAPTYSTVSDPVSDEPVQSMHWIPLNELEEGAHYVCLGALVLMTENDDPSVEKITHPQLSREMYRFIAENVVGYPHVIVSSDDTAAAISKGEVLNQGRGVTFGPQASGFFGSFFAGLPIGISRSRSNGSRVGLPGRGAVLVAKTPPWVTQSRRLVLPASQVDTKAEYTNEVDRRAAAAQRGR